MIIKCSHLLEGVIYCLHNIYDLPLLAGSRVCVMKRTPMSPHDITNNLTFFMIVWFVHFDSC